MKHVVTQIVTLSGTTKQSLPIFEVTMTLLDSKASEKIELTGSKLSDFTTVHHPKLRDLKSKYKHTADKGFYMNQGDEYQMRVILGDSTYCRIKNGGSFQGEPRWTVHGGEFQSDGCWFSGEVQDCHQLYSLDVLGVEDRGENDQLDVH